MGFSTVTAETMFFIAVVLLSAGLISLFSVYVDQTKGAISDKQQYITSQLRTDIAITNIYNSSGDLLIYVKNVGNQQLKTACVELYVDGSWVPLAQNRITDPSTAAEVADWDAQATIKLDPASAPLNSGSVHEAKFVTCNGIWDTEGF